MTTQEVVNRYMALAKEGKYSEIQDELYGADVVCKEPEHAAAIGLPTVTKGFAAVKEKSKKWKEGIKEVHGGHCGEPVVVGDFFSMPMGIDITMKNGQRMKLDQISVFEVKNGKIVLEQFFY